MTDRLQEKKNTILLISEDTGLLEILKEIQPQEIDSVLIANNLQETMKILFSEPLSMMLIDEPFLGIHPNFVLELKSDQVYGIIPIILIVSSSFIKKNIRWESSPADSFIIKPINKNELFQRIILHLNNVSSSMSKNPLTNLPGNISIIREIQSKIDKNERFAVCYLDLDNFKPFNDKYGFTRGDEILRMTARIIKNSIRSKNSLGGFAGHVGGDDFVFVIPPESVDKICKEIVDNFSFLAPSFYDEEDRRQKRINSLDREGNPKIFPLLSLSIAVVSNEIYDIKFYSEASDIACTLKSVAKKAGGNKVVKNADQMDLQKTV